MSAPHPCHCAHLEQIVVFCRVADEPQRREHARCIHPAGPHPMNEFCQWRTPKTEGAME